MTELIGTGLKGLIGSKLVDQLVDTYNWTSLDVSDSVQPVDITDADQVKKAMVQSEAAFVVHLAAFTDVTAAWQQQGDKTGPAYRVNVEGTKNVATACAETNKHLIHVSTAFVFDGTKESSYTEEDSPNPIEWYGRTKLLAEEEVVRAGCASTILRIDFPFRLDEFARPDIVTKTLGGVAKGYPLFEDHFFGPTLIEDFVKVVDWVVRTRTTGLFHSSNGERWSDYQLGVALKERFGFSTEVKKGSLIEYLKTNQRPYQVNTALDNSKLQSLLDFKMLSIQEALVKVERDLISLGL